MADFEKVLPTLCWFLVFISTTWYWQVDAFKGTVFQFTHEVSLSSGIKVRWTTKDPEWITFEMSSPTTGYIGIGFSHTGNMAGSDIYIGWVDSSGTAQVKVMRTTVYNHIHGMLFKSVLVQSHLLLQMYIHMVYGII